MPRVRLGVLLTSITLLIGSAVGQVMLIITGPSDWWLIPILIIIAIIIGRLITEESLVFVISYTVWAVVDVVSGILILHTSLAASIAFLILAFLTLLDLSISIEDYTH